MTITLHGITDVTPEASCVFVRFDKAWNRWNVYPIDKNGLGLKNGDLVYGYSKVKAIDRARKMAKSLVSSGLAGADLYIAVKQRTGAGKIDRYAA